VSIQKWTNSPQFGMIRDIQYYAPVKVPLGPDKTRVQETQRYVLSRTRLLIETVTMMFDIPYGDSFRLESKWLVTSPSATANTCTLQVSMCVHFVKKTWFKGKIESASMKEVKESFKQWTEAAHEELAKPEVRDKISGAGPLLPSKTIVLSQSTSNVIAQADITPTLNAKPPIPAALESSTSTSSNSTTTGKAQAQTKSGALEIKFMSTADKESAASSKATHSAKKLPMLPSMMPGVNLQGITVQADKQTVLMLLVFILSFFCIYLYCKLAYLEGKFSVVENIFQKHLHLKGEPVD